MQVLAWDGSVPRRQSSFLGFSLPFAISKKWGEGAWSAQGERGRLRVPLGKRDLPRTAHGVCRLRSVAWQDGGDKVRWQLGTQWMATPAQLTVPTLPIHTLAPLLKGEKRPSLTDSCVRTSLRRHRDEALQERGPGHYEQNTRTSDRGRGDSCAFFRPLAIGSSVYGCIERVQGFFLSHPEFGRRGVDSIGTAMQEGRRKRGEGTLQNAN
jgi:hypothetical protein